MTIRCADFRTTEKSGFTHFYEFEPLDAESKEKYEAACRLKLSSIAAGPYRIFAQHSETRVVEKGEKVDRVSRHLVVSEPAPRRDTNAENMAGLDTEVNQQPLRFVGSQLIDLPLECPRAKNLNRRPEEEVRKHCETKANNMRGGVIDYSDKDQDERNLSSNNEGSLTHDTRRRRSSPRSCTTGMMRVRTGMRVDPSSTHITPKKRAKMKRRT